MRFLTKRSILFVVIAAVALMIGAYAYIFKSNVPNKLEQSYLYIHTDTDYNALVDSLVLNKFIIDKSNFELWAKYLKFTKPKAGKYKIMPKWSSYKLIKLLRSGDQIPVKVVLNNEKTPAQVAGKIATTLEMDSITFLKAFNDSMLIDSLGFNQDNLMCLFIPNTYECYWNTSPKKFLERMIREYKGFWTDERKSKAKAYNLTPNDIIAIASIVESETNHKDEKPKVAGVYLNRIQQNMPLQADPTVQYALMDIEQTGTFRRLYNNDYTVKHRFNTYINQGPPPGPVCMPSIATIDAVLNAEKNNYIFFVAKPDLSGYHDFAESYQAHLVNVHRYQQWLKEYMRNN
jgi:UPF0755 protein